MKSGEVPGYGAARLEMKAQPEQNAPRNPLLSALKSHRRVHLQSLTKYSTQATFYRPARNKHAGEKRTERRSICKVTTLRTQYVKTNASHNIEAPRTKSAKGELNPAKRLFKILGPGLITGASDDDPSGIVTYAQAGAQFGFQPLWTAFFTFPLMASIQYICAKIGLVSGQGLTSIIRDHYPPWVLYSAISLLVIANTLNAGADIGAIGSCAHLLIPALPSEVAVLPVTALIVVLLIFASYEFISRTFKWLTLSLFAYIVSSVLTNPDWLAVAKATFIPHIQLDKTFLSMMVAILGTTISPYLFFWQTRSEVEEQKQEGLDDEQRKGATTDDLKYAALDVNCGMLFSNIVMYFIILGSATSLRSHGQYLIESPQQAAQALRPIAGDMASLLFSAGIIGTGFLAVPVLVGTSSYAMSELFGWRNGLNEKWYRAKRFYAVMTLTAIIGMTINFVGLNPMTTLVWTAVINGLLAPPLLLLIMLISNNKKVMGDKANHPIINCAGWLTTLLMTAAAVALIVLSFTGG